MIQGPTAGGISGPTAGGAAGGAPFAAVEEPDHAEDIARNRTRSWVTFAIIGAMVLLLLGSFTVAGVGLVAFFYFQVEEEEESGRAPVVESHTEVALHRTATAAPGPCG